MKLFILAVSYMVLANASPHLIRRDIAENLNGPEKSYLPPEITNHEELSMKTGSAEVITTEEQIPETTSQPIEETAILGENGYEYKTVRKVVVRNRRDVSHLKLNYLPPFESHQPSNEYLPPLSNDLTEETTLPAHEENQAAMITEIPTEVPQPSNEYLPPHLQKETQEVKAKETPGPIKEYLPPQETESSSKPKVSEEVLSEPNETTTLVPQEDDNSEIIESAEPQEDTAVLAEDGYHYKAPSEVPTELFSIQPEPIMENIPPSPEYLAPASDDSVENEHPNNGESAALAEDGYRYRFVKRRY
ncbi:uncharacterized protein LOC142234396 [Haematobia irritans]|uniref:uncharacterized protein LOC142234396 n=1 Tax=Haematobia irritans TaxID=7368 RepID=UPI003F4FE611